MDAVGGIRISESEEWDFTNLAVGEPICSPREKPLKTVKQHTSQDDFLDFKQISLAKSG